MSTVRMPALKAWQLKYGAFLTGLPTTGTKAELQSLLLKHLDEPSSDRQRPRIISVDMGIRNLAFCVVETHATSRVKVTAWKRLDLLDRGMNAKDVSEEDQVKRSRTPPARDAFTPPALSKIALAVTEELLSHSPSAILIERQRFRSGGAAAIQEWTVRVNMLESMLWACMETLRSRASNSAFPATYAISPSRVADFWTSPLSTWSQDLLLSEEAVMPEVQPARRKVDKKAKIDLVRSWVLGESALEIDFSGSAAEIATAFEVDRRKQKAIQELAGGKIDDLADCMLQAVAWVTWQENMSVLRRMWQWHQHG